MLGMDKEQKLQEKVPAFAFYVKTGQQFFDAVKYSRVVSISVGSFVDASCNIRWRSYDEQRNRWFRVNILLIKKKLLK